MELTPQKYADLKGNKHVVVDGKYQKGREYTAKLKGSPSLKVRCQSWWGHDRGSNSNMILIS